MAKLLVRLLGKFEVCREALPLPGLEPRKLQELLCYLLLHPQRSYLRESLVELISGEADAEHSRKYFRQALWQLQAAFNAPDAAEEEARLLVVDAEWVYLNPNFDLWVDVVEFEAACALAAGRPGETLPDDTARRLEGAVQLYRGDLLDGCYQDWCLFERERLLNLYLSMLDKLMGYCAARGAYEAGVQHGARILREDRARERTHQRLMQLHYLAGDRTAALRQYDQCAAALQEELGVKPSQKTAALYAQIRADQLPPAALPAITAQPSQPAPADAAPPATAAMLFEQIRRSAETLGYLQLQINHDLATLRQLFDHGI